MLHALAVASVFFAMVCAPALVSIKVDEHMDDEDDELEQADTTR